MLQSGSNIKSLEISVHPVDAPAEDEVAACVAAIWTIIGEAQECGTSEPQSSPSNWQRASRIEGTVRRAPATGGNLWWSSGLPFLLLIGLFAFGLASKAADSESTTIAAAMPAGKPALPGSSDREGILVAGEDARALRERMIALFAIARPPKTSKRTYIKVGLSVSASRIELEALDGAEVRDAANGNVVANLPALSQWSINIDKVQNLAFLGKNAIDGDPQNKSVITKVAYFPGAARLQFKHFQLPAQADQSSLAGSSGYLVVPQGDADGNQVMVLNGKLYRGSIWLKPCYDALDGKQTTTGISAINIVDLEDYLLSVLPGEMPATWPIESLKAQAVAARSYAVANIGKHAKDGYDLKANVEDQVYSGIALEHAASNRAVAETEGIILTHQGKPVSAFFHSTSGGSTELAENVWGRPVPYLRMVTDYDDLSPHFSWNRKFKVEDLEAAFGPEIGQLTSFMVISRTASNRVKDSLVVGTKGSRYVSGDALRKLFKLPSTNFNVGYKENSYEFAGRGSGHGLGLSQWGARALADEGYNAAQILTYYYKDVAVDYLADTPGI